MHRIQVRRASYIVVAAAALFAACKKDPTGPVLEVPTLPEAPAQTVLLHDVLDNENNGQGAYNWTAFQHWTVVAGCVDLHGNGFHDVLRGNGLYIDLDGTCERGGTLESKESFALEAGKTYVLEFWLAGNQRIRAPDRVIVSLGSLFEEEFVLAQRDPFRLHTRQISVTANTSAKLRFRNMGGDNQGALLDQVRLRVAQ
jgi:hypothetical protein